VPDLPTQFRAFVAEQRDGDVVREVRTLDVDSLGDGDVVIRVAWSGVNFKDALASTAGGKVARLPTLVPGIDLAGQVVDPGSSGLSAGDAVLAHGYDIGVAHHGGFAEYARVPAGWVVALPDGLQPREAMTIGTAGFTAALSVAALESHGLTPGTGPVLVTGATGGVGSVAVNILAKRGYEVVASTGKAASAQWLLDLGAAATIDRAETSAEGKPLERERWAGAVDCVGGDTLAYALRTLKYGGAVAASGNTGGTKLASTVFPFILRGVSLLGIDSVAVPIQRRRELWQRLATDLRPEGLGQIGGTEIDLDGLGPVLDAILAGDSQGRSLVRLS
jgi:acrylyl-CoA reductase (NADPH)